MLKNISSHGHGGRSGCYVTVGALHANETVSNPTTATKNCSSNPPEKNAATKMMGSILVDGFDKRRPVALYKAIAQFNE